MPPPDFFVTPSVHRTSLLTCRDSKLIAISDYSNRHSIYFWNIACDWLRIDRLRASQQRATRTPRALVWLTKDATHSAKRPQDSPWGRFFYGSRPSTRNQSPSSPGREP